MSDPNYAETPQAAPQIGIEADITTPGKLIAFPPISEPPLIQVDNLLNLDADDLDGVGCPICHSWTGAMFEDGSCDNPQCPTNRKGSDAP
jgi:hypothetical protein